LKRAEKPHSKFSDRKALDGPATRPETPLAVENGVGLLSKDDFNKMTTHLRAMRASIMSPTTNKGCYQFAFK
jgi:hypothetical protein